ncbi:MAG: DUF1616 domain-containing protein [Archaeoglobaceae archaeon]
MVRIDRTLIDLLVVILFVIISALFVTIPPLNETPVRAVLGLPLVLFVPGYALISALFPRNDDLDGIERVALSIGLSICVVVFVGLALNFTPWGIRLGPILLSLSGFTLLMVAATSLRRVKVPVQDRFTI